MTVGDAVRAMCKRTKKTQEDIAIGLGYANRVGFAKQVVRSSMKVDVLAKAADFCGYDLVLRPKSMGMDKTGELIVIEYKGEMDGEE